MFRIRGIGRAKRLVGRVRGRFWPGPVVLGYHRVADSDWDPQHLCVSPKHFAEQLDVLTSMLTPSSVSGVSGALSGGQDLGTPFVLTLDDGYLDSLEAAAPILARYDVPATVYVTTGMVGKRYWWCEVQHLIETSDTLPSGIGFEIDDHEFRWSKTSDTLKHRARLVRSLGDLFRTLPFDRHDDALAAVRSAFNREDKSDVLAMTAEQVSELSATDLIDIGSHMVTHTSLSYLAPAAQRDELSRSKSELEAMCGRPVTSCAYPNGRYSRRTPALVRDAGYDAACSSDEMLVWQGTDPYQIPRLWVGDWDGDQFARWLRRWVRT